MTQRVVLNRTELQKVVGAHQRLIGMRDTRGHRPAVLRDDPEKPELLSTFGAIEGRLGRNAPDVVERRNREHYDTGARYTMSVATMGYRRQLCDRLHDRYRAKDVQQIIDGQRDGVFKQYTSDMEASMAATIGPYVDSHGPMPTTRRYRPTSIRRCTASSTDSRGSRP